MIAQVDVSASTPSHRIGLSMRPRSSRALLIRPNVGLNSQYHSRLDTPRPMTTGMNTTVRVIRRSGVLGDDEQGEQVAADDQDRRDEQRCTSGCRPSDTQNWSSANARWKLPVPTNFGGVISDQLLNDIQTIWASG